MPGRSSASLGLQEAFPGELRLEDPRLVVVGDVRHRGGERRLGVRERRRTLPLQRLRAILGRPHLPLPRSVTRAERGLQLQRPGRRPAGFQRLATPARSRLARPGDLAGGELFAPLAFPRALEPGFDVGLKVRRPLRAVLLLLRQGAQADRLEFLRNLRDLRRRAHRPTDDRGQHLEGRVPAVRRPPRQDLVEDRAQRIHVAALVQLGQPSRRLLRRHVRRRPEHVASSVRWLDSARSATASPGSVRGRARTRRSPVLGLADQARQPPVHPQRLAEIGDHHVRRLEVPVDHPARVRERHRPAHVPKRLHQPPQLPPAPVNRPVQLASRNLLHRKIHALRPRQLPISCTDDVRRSRRPVIRASQRSAAPPPARRRTRS